MAVPLLKLVLEDDLSNEIGEEPPAKKARFGVVADHQMTSMEGEAVPATTKCTTKTWVAVFEAYLQEKGIRLDLKTVEAEKLASILRQFYVEVRRQDGSTYQRASLMGIRAALQRHIRSRPTGRTDLDLIQGKEFVEANRMLDAYLKHLAKEGQLQPPQHKEPLTKEDLEKCLNYFYEKAESDPRVLTQAVWFFITYHFALRAKEVQENMKTSHLLFTKVGDVEVVKLATEYRTKNHQGGLRSSENSCSEGQVQDPRQIRLIKLLISKLHPETDYLYMKARADAKWTKEAAVWYTQCKLGHNLIARFMPALSVQLSLSNRYTGHCLRVTATQNLCNAFVPNQHVMKITGHRNEASLRSYNARSTEGQRILMSNLLDKPIDDSDGTFQSAACRSPVIATQPTLATTSLTHAPSSTPSVLAPARVQTVCSQLGEKDWDAAMINAVSNVMNKVEQSHHHAQRVFGQAATFTHCSFHFN